VSKTILLVEDEENDVFFMKHAFKEVGILNPLQVAQDGKEAMDYLSGNGGYADRERFPLPCLTLLDLKLPRVTGLEVLKWMREQPELKPLIVIILTSSRLGADIEMAYQLGANAYLVKPSSPRELREIAMGIKQFWLEWNHGWEVRQESADSGQNAARDEGGIRKKNHACVPGHDLRIEQTGPRTEDKRTEAQLKASLKEISDFKAALDEHAIVAITDPQGRITYANDKFCAISKYSRAELLGQDHRIINSGFHPKEFMRDMWTTIGRGKVWRGEIRNKAKDGSFYWVATTIVPFLNEDAKPRQYIAIRFDISERKAAEEKIHLLNVELEKRVLERTAQLQSANQEMEAFNYSVSHDLRAPLRHVLGFADLLQKEAGPSLSGKSLSHLTTISQAAKRMGHLIDDLLAFSRAGQAELQKTDVNLDELVREALGDFQADTKERNIVWEIHPLPAVRADHALLRLALVNLISNAVKFTSARAEAKIEIGCAPSGNGETVIFIRDNGAGFDPRYAGKLFGVFQRLHSQDKFGGTGIGLANVQRIVHRHGGRTWAEGAVDGGATFYFSIPKEKGTHSGCA
jgi:PAS domain S-box-containing protein